MVFVYPFLAIGAAYKVLPYMAIRYAFFLSIVSLFDIAGTSVIKYFFIIIEKY